MNIKLLVAFSLGALSGATGMYKFGKSIMVKEVVPAIQFLGKMMSDRGIVPTEFELMALRDMAKYYPKDDDDEAGKLDDD